VVQDNPSTPALKRRLMLSGMGLIVGLILAEVGLRLWAPPGVSFVLDATTSTFEPGMFQEDPVLLQRLAPSSTTTVRSVQGDRVVQTNALGMRGPQLQDKALDDIRVLALGDSFTLGLQVDHADTWASKLGQRLSESLSTRVEVLNAGMVGYGTRQATRRLEELASVTEADAAILLFYLGNDLRDNIRYPRLKQARLAPPPQNPPPEPPQTKDWQRALARGSHLVAHLLAWMQTRSVADDFRLMEYQDEMRPYVDPGRLEGLIPLTKTALQDFGRSCKNAGIPCMIVLAPPAYAVHTDRLSATFEAFGLDPSAVDLDAPAKAVIKAAPIGMPVLDLSSSMRAVAAERAMYLTFDPHWSAQGHAVAAEIMTTAVAQMVQGKVQ
jgi:hypothetical protein